MNELSFTEDRNLRDNCISHYEVLERVKNLLLIPGTEFATMKQVAEFYDVEVKAIEKVCLRNKDELISDGVELKSYKDFLKRRGDKPYIQHVKQEEWKFVIMTFSAMCEVYGQSPSDMFQQATPKKALKTNY